MFHVPPDGRCNFFGVLLGRLHDDLVVDLIDHPEAPRPQVRAELDAEHRVLDDVGGTTLNRGIDGLALSMSTDHEVTVVDVLCETTAPSADRHDVTVLHAELDGVVDVRVYAREHLAQ